MQRQKLLRTTYVGLMIVLLTLASSAWAAEYKALYKFRAGGGDGWYPHCSLIFDTAGNLYGTTLQGGSHGAGTVFKLSPNPDGSWTESVLHSFSGTDGREPYAGLISDAAGSLYGTTEWGEDAR